MNDAQAFRAQPSSLSARLPLPMGTRIDHYVLKDVLGAGGFGITYLAVHEALGKLYALKEYFPSAFSYRDGTVVLPTEASNSTYEWGLERFITEARALAKFKHPSIVDVTSVFEANGTAYIVLAYEPGRSMNEWLKQLGRRPTQVELDQIVDPLLGALQVIHDHDLLHRDIAPDNLLIREDGAPVLIDFGSARESVRGHARALSMIVKQGYSPPEQYSNKPGLQGPWTDIYALAATLYRAVAGQLPPEATERLLKDDLQPVGSLAQGAYRPSFLTAIMKGLRIRTQERPQTVAEWRGELLQTGSVRATTSRVVRAGAAASTTSGPRSALARPATARATTGTVSQRISQRVSERPDLSWLDEAEGKAAEATAPPPESMMDKPEVQTLWYAVVGLCCGAAAGALFAIVLASVVSASCFADSCFKMYLWSCTSIGTVLGALAGGYIARNKAAEEAAAKTRHTLPNNPI